MCTHIYVYMFMFIYTYMYIHIHKYIYTNVYIHTYICICDLNILVCGVPHRGQRGVCMISISFRGQRVLAVATFLCFPMTRSTARGAHLIECTVRTTRVETNKNLNMYKWMYIYTYINISILIHVLIHIKIYRDIHIYTYLNIKKWYFNNHLLVSFCNVHFLLNTFSILFVWSTLEDWYLYMWIYEYGHICDVNSRARI
jgi:hypothetical protein